MSKHSVNSCPVDTRRPLRVGALTLAGLMLLTACSTGAPVGAAYRHYPSTLRDSPEAWSLESEADDGHEGDFVFAKLPTDFAPVQVNDSDLTAALATLWLNMPLRVATSHPPPLYVGHKLTLVSMPLSGEAWPSDGQSFA
jgi:hypothetical protein